MTIRKIAPKWNPNYVVRQSDIDKVVDYVNGLHGHCHVQSPIRHFKTVFPNVNWPKVIDAAVQQGVLYRDRRLLTTKPIAAVKAQCCVHKVKKIPVLIMTVFFAISAFASPYVTNVVAKARMPWNGLVDVSYEIVGSTNGLEYAYGQLTATDRTRGKTYVASTFEKKIDLTEGKHTAIWNMAADSSFTSKDVVFNMSIRVPALYCVIDLSDGPNATSYPVSDLDDVPAGGWTDEYKTTKLVLRRINPGTFIMGSDQTDESHRVWITKPFYIGVFEVTQKQYELVMGSCPKEIGSKYPNGDAYPLYKVEYEIIRGGIDTVIGKFQARTGLDVDLPKESQWEYACRSGTKTVYYWGGEMSGDFAVYKGNSEMFLCVGTKMPNEWGLYDMSGNVEEWCLDLFENVTYGIDPTVPEISSGSTRVQRGGNWASDAGSCTSASRDHYEARHNYLSIGSGIRLVINQK